MTITSTPSTHADQPAHVNFPPSGTLRLRGAATPQATQGAERRVQWAEDVVNNEGMGKKKSKVCCIYHKPRTVGESSDEDSSSDSSDDDGDGDSGSNDDGAARPANSAGHRHGDDSCGQHQSGKAKGRTKQPSPNAYEKQPKPALKRPVDV
ncbi:MAG: Type 1 phosphatases regulator ypi1 [Chrysothrix sp. TS-e1954]|nr:MAG: Type 1 phosphatases regulator ypi1 [Chrysothrix sp. TS-e1954]